MNTIIDLLSSVYSQTETKEIIAGIDSLLLKYSSSKESPSDISEKDVVMIAYGDHVRKPDQSHLRTLKEFVDKQLSESITTIHILPFYPFSSDDGFSVIDYYQVDKTLGNWDEIESLSGDYKIMFDAVINHASQSSDWFKRYLNEDGEYAKYFISVENEDDYKEVVRPRTSPLFHSYVGKSGTKRVWTTFSEDQVDLNYANPELLLHILDLLLFYVSKGAKLIRLDAIGFMWKEPNTTSIHLSQTHSLIKVFRKVIERVDPTIKLITETNVPHQENISYFGSGDEAHMVYNFALPPLVAFSLLNGNCRKLSEWARALELPTDNTCFFNFLASHDGIGVRPVDGILNQNEVAALIESAEANLGKVSYRSDAQGNHLPYEINCNYFSLLKGPHQNESVGIERMVLAHAILLAMPGVPAIYFSSLIGASNYLKGIEKGGANRSINREKFDLEKISNRLADSTTTNNAIFSSLKKLIQIRQKEPVFHPSGAFQIENISDKVFVIKRTSANHDAISCYFNVTDQIMEVKIPEVGSDLISGETISHNGQLQPYSFWWLKTKRHES